MAKHSDRYESLRLGIEEELDDYTREDRIANYGYASAYYTLGLITLDEMNELTDLLGLTDQDVDDLRV